MDNAEEDYIDIELTSSSSSSSSYLCYSLSSTEFEFQMSSTSTEKESTPSPADELFYKGNLLPLHLPPRLQMVQKLLQNSNTSTSTPFDSCNTSPTCKLSEELNPEELFHDCSTELSDDPSKKLEIKQSNSKLNLKLKAYFKCLFREENGRDRVMKRAKECLKKCMKITKKKSHEENEKEKMVEESSSHRRSFSLSMKKQPSTKSTSFSSLSSGSSSSGSSTTSSLSSGLYDVHLLKRSSSASSEIASSIEGAIAYCKQSQEVFCLKKEEEELCALSASRIAACEVQDRAEVSRG